MDHDVTMIYTDNFGIEHREGAYRGCPPCAHCTECRPLIRHVDAGLLLLQALTKLHDLGLGVGVFTCETVNGWAGG